MMERTLKVLVAGATKTMSRSELVEIFGGDDAEEIVAIWQMERHDTWYVTFSDSDLVNHYDGKTISCTGRGIALHLNACDRITVKARIHWLPIWVSNEDLARVLESRGDIKSMHHVTEKNIITGVREVVFSMREGDQHHLPYLTSVHGHRCLLSVPGRPPICFRCEGVGHLRHQCPHGDRPKLRSYASAVQGPVVGKRGEESVGKTPLQAVRKPTGEEPSGSPSNQGDSSGPQEDLVVSQTGPPQDNQEDHGSPNEGVEPVGSTPDGKGLESPDTEGDTEVSTRWADTEVSPMDVGGSLHLDDEGFLEVRHKKRRAEPDPPISPLAAQPSRANRE